jgi:ABC-type Zn uptake system ZnuABC Zn-binding protein ZnuA
MRWTPIRPPRGAYPLMAGACVLALGLAACGDTGSAGAQSTLAGASPRLKIVATTTQVADFAREIGGDRADVTQILKPNVDPHDYEASPADVAAIGSADLLVINGVGLERWLVDAVTASGFKGAEVDTSKGVTIRQGNGSDEEKTGDPHIWHDPMNAKIMASNIETAYAAADPGEAPAFRANLNRYDAKLDALDADIRRRIDTLATANRKLVTNHDAFGYYIARYHLTFVGSAIPSFDTSAELSGKDINELVAKIKQTGTTAIFSESSLPPKTAETIAAEAGVKVEAGLNSLYGDTLGPAGSDGATYLQMEEHNTRTIVAALR